MNKIYCPKCGNSDYFMSKRNVIKGTGWTVRGKMELIPVCRTCDEIMVITTFLQKYAITTKPYELLIDFLLLMFFLLSLSGAGDYGYLFLVALCPLVFLLFRMKKRFWKKG